MVRVVSSRIGALSLPPIVVLLLLRRGARRTKNTEQSREELSGSSFDDGDDVSSMLRLLLVRDFLLLEKHESLSFDFDIVLFLVVLSHIASGSRIVRRLLLLSLLLLLFLLRSPHIVDIEQFDSDDISFERSISILRSADVNIGIERIRRNVGVRSVLLVDS